MADVLAAAMTGCGVSMAAFLPIIGVGLVVNGITSFGISMVSGMGSWASILEVSGGIGHGLQRRDRNGGAIRGVRVSVVSIAGNPRARKPRGRGGRNVDPKRMKPFPGLG